MNIELTKNDNGYNGIKYCAMATAGTGQRWDLNCIRITDGWIQSTDGHRIHQTYNGSQLEDGFYQVIKVLKTKVVIKKVDGVVHPDFYRIYGNVLLSDDCIEVPARNKNNKLRVDLANTQLARILPESAGINYSYLSEALDFDGPSQIYYDVKSTPIVYVINSVSFAVIMPFRV